MKNLTDLHEIRGSLWYVNCLGDCILILVQIETDVYKFIDLERANRYSDTFFHSTEGIKKFKKYIKENRIEKLKMNIKDLMTPAFKVLYCE